MNARPSGKSSEFADVCLCRKSCGKGRSARIESHGNRAVAGRTACGRSRNVDVHATCSRSCDLRQQFRSCDFACRAVSQLASALAANAGSDSFISVIGPYLRKPRGSRPPCRSRPASDCRCVGKIFADDLLSRLSSVTAARALRVSVDVAAVEPVELEHRELLGPLRRGFERERKLAQHVALAGLEHRGIDAP